MLRLQTLFAFTNNGNPSMISLNGPIIMALRYIAPPDFTTLHRPCTKTPQDMDGPLILIFPTLKPLKISKKKFLQLLFENYIYMLWGRNWKKKVQS